jgi:hypothetical protein
MILESNQYQFLGTLDLLGLMNSRSIGGDIARKTPVPGVWHSLNTKLPGHMDVKKLLEEKVIPTLPIPTATRSISPVADERRNRIAAAFKARANSN